MLTDLPYKILNTITFNLALYFMTNLNRHPGNFFFYLLISFTLTLVMSMLFRTIASVSRTLSQALAPAAILILGIVIYTGFALPIPYMRGWARWINYVDPVSYGFESLMINEFAGRNFTCDATAFIPQGPAYANAQPFERVCSAVGSVAGSAVVQGTAFIESSYMYYPKNKWRNYGILWVFVVGLCACYLIATEYITSKKSKGEVLLFRRGHTPAVLKQRGDDVEAGGNAMALHKSSTTVDVSAVLNKQTAIFHWEDVCYDIKIKKEDRRILDHVDGWVKPGTLTALMVSTDFQTLGNVSNWSRVSLVPVRPLSSMSLLLEQRSVLSLETCLWMGENVMPRSNAKLDTFNNKIFIYRLLLSAKL